MKRWYVLLSDLSDSDVQQLVDATDGYAERWDDEDCLGVGIVFGNIDFYWSEEYSNKDRVTREEAFRLMEIKLESDIGKLTKEQAIVVSAYTGCLLCDFSDLHKEVEERMGRPFFTHEFATKHEEVKELFKEDFISLLPEEYCDKGE